MTMFTRKLRAATEAELAQLRHHLSGGSLGNLHIAYIAVSFYLVMVNRDLFVDYVDLWPSDSAKPWWVGLLLGCIVAAAFYPRTSRLDRESLRDLVKQKVKVLRVTTDRCVWLEYGYTKILAIELDRDRLLTLHAIDLIDPKLFGWQLPDRYWSNEFLDEQVLGLPETANFPNTEFEISYFPNSGKLLSIRTYGKPIQSEVIQLRRDIRTRSHNPMLVGTIDRLIRNVKWTGKLYARAW